ncbi:MAG TPA: phospholipid carrier-dependent glycosyltransferase [Candidatus Limnocylindrales bacterium]|nr:phospholipid carrier-dependent glycosyltransferase [Candidatus Limnocylindrales bacterium]
MTASGSGAPDRVGTAAGTVRGTIAPIVVVLAAGFAFRCILAHLLPGSGFRVDLDAFRFWANDLATNGPYGFYSRPFFHDYTPGYLYALWMVGIVGKALDGIGDLIKVPAILADVALAFVVFRILRDDLGVRERRALAGAGIVLANPIAWFDSVVWGQVDSVGVVFLLLAVRELWRGRTERSAVLAVTAALIKPQLGILAPLIAAVTIRRALRPGDAETEGGTAWERGTRGPVRIVTTGLAGFAMAVALSLPFGLSVVEPAPTFPYVDSDLARQLVSTAAGYPYLTVNAYNPWALLSVDGNGLAANGTWVCDALVPPAIAGNPDAPCQAVDPPPGVGLVLGVPAVLVGSVGLIVVILATCVLVALRPDRRTILVGLAVLALAFFVVPTRVHERYLFPLYGVAAILAAVSRRWAVAYLVGSIATFLNMYVVLTTIYPGNPGISDWLGIGGAVRSSTGVAAIAVAHLAVFVWAVLQLRPAARARLADEIADARAPARVRDPIVPDAEAGPVDERAGLAAATPADWPVAGELPDEPSPPPRPGIRPMPAWLATGSLGSLGVVGWLRARMRERPWRADRSRMLAFERGGRLDRLDVWLLAVLLVASLGLRTFRLAEPAQMHFDEVYHARTATEFLQHWRYGISHDIYEWTHPHLAKYAMALGLVAFADQGLAGRSDLGVPVRDAVIEPRRDSAFDPAGAGDRIWAATGSELVAYDLGSRAAVARWSVAGASSLELDTAGPTLLIGTDRGGILTLDLEAVELVLPEWQAGGTTRVDPVPLATLEGGVDQVVPVPGGADLAALVGSEVRFVDLATGSVRAGVPVDGAASIVPAGLAEVVVVDPNAVTDPAAAASELATLLTDDAARIEALLAGTSGQEVIVAAGLTDDERTALDAAIADGRLDGVRVDEAGRVAVLGAEGVTLLAADGASLGSIPLEGGASGAAQITGVGENPELYVATTSPDSGGGAVAVVTLGDDLSGTPTMLPMPGTVSDVRFDPASKLVHVVGATPEGDATTVYVIEPNGRAVFADHRLPFDPSALVLDTAPPYPAADRGQLLAFSGDGAVASADIGHYPFAWRLPGVIAGVLTLVLLYLLARVLFARRSVALLVGVFGLLDGMLFVQSRIAMNDVYVGLFILAAYTLFAWLWTATRARWAFWALMPVIGLLLGLALASKWVAAYAIGALGILILARSALGRVLLVLGLVGITTVLGWLAIAVPEGGGGGNLTFMLLMIGLTLLAVVVSVLRPIAWTADEVRFAVAAPAVAGLVAAGGLLLAGGGSSAALVAFGGAAASVAVYAAFVGAGRLGFGPLSPPPDPELDALVGPPARAPEAPWLRLGALGGLPVLWLAASLVAIPIVVYVVSYVPWAYLDNHAIVTGWPDGHDGQTLAQLTGEMYRYHDQLTAAHAASSPWWAWPLNLKPVWFYQGGFAADTAGAIYDAGNLVIWWLGIPAMGFVAYQAFRRRSLGLALIAIGFACQWIPWARIDRASFQYHYYTSLPFVILALGYFVAELWHGASGATWRLARVAAALAVLGSPILWLLRLPACAFVRVEAVNPGSQACVGNPGNLEVTASALAMTVVGIGTLLAFGSEVARLRRAREDLAASSLVPIVVIAVVGAVLLGIASGIPGSAAVISLPGLVPEAIALVVAIPLGLIALQVLTARDARRFVVGLVLAAATWFLVLYPNISALQLPSRLVNAYQGILPTYLYPFQFPVSTVERGGSISFTDPRVAILAASLLVASVIVGYAAWAWRIALAERAADDAAGIPAGSGGPGLAPGGGP